MDLNHTPQRHQIPRSREMDADIIEFEQRDGLGRIWLHGIVADAVRDERHYSGFHKALRCLIYGEPYQLRKAGRNNYGVTACYTTLRLEPLEQNGTAREVLCFGELSSRLACGDEVRLQVRRVRGRYHFAQGKNLTLGCRIRRDLFCVRLLTLAVPMFLLGWGFLVLLPALLPFFAELLSSFLTLVVMGFLLYYLVFRDIPKLFR